MDEDSGSGTLSSAAQSTDVRRLFYETFQHLFSISLRTGPRRSAIVELNLGHLSYSLASPLGRILCEARK